MRGILNLLAKANLVELSDEEKAEAGIDNSEMPLTVPEAVQPAAPEPTPLKDLLPLGGEVTENRPVEEIYAAAGLTQPSFPAEKLLRLLDGLRPMDAATRKTAVQAMDAADDNWQIGDCVVDAEQKVAVLNAYKQYLASQLLGAEQQSVARIAEIKSGLENSSTEIRSQIANLEQLLEREITKSAQQTTSIESGVRAVRETVGRESRRIDTEIERLREIPAQFKADNTQQ